MKLRKYTENQLLKACSDATSIANALSLLNVAPYGGNYATFRKAVKYFGIDTLHFVGQRHNKGRVIGPKRPIKDYLSNTIGIRSSKLRLRLIREGVLDATCFSCHLSKWLNNLIPLELHHINGDRNDNSLKNLQLLCPNCHTFTNTYRGRNIGKR